jgi:hypothetical protein
LARAPRIHVAQSNTSSVDLANLRNCDRFSADLHKAARGIGSVNFMAEKANVSRLLHNRQPVLILARFFTPLKRQKFESAPRNKMTSPLELPDTLSPIFALLEPAYLYFARQVCRLWYHEATWFWQQKPHPHRDFVRPLARNGHFELIKLTAGVMFGLGMINDKINPQFYKNLEFAQWFEKNRPYQDSCYCKYAIRVGNLEVLQWVFENCQSSGRHQISRAVGESGSLDVLNFAVKNYGFPNHSDHENLRLNILQCYSGAAIGGHIHIAEALHREWKIDILEGSMYNSDPCIYAADGGHLEMLKWLQNKGFYMSPYIVRRACTSESRETVAWLLDQGHTWGNACHEFLNMSYDFMIWCLDHGCPASADGIMQGAGRGRFDPRVFEYLDERYNLLALRTRDDALHTFTRSRRYIKYMVNRGFQFPKFGKDSTIISAKRFQIVRIGIRKGYLTWCPEFAVKAASSGDGFEFLRWAWRAGYEFPKLEEFAKYQDFRYAPKFITRWLKLAIAE